MSLPAWSTYRDRLERIAEQLRFEVAESEQGRVVSAGDGIAIVRGLESIRLNELVRIGDRGDGLAMDLVEDHIGVVLLNSVELATVGAPVVATGRVAATTVGEALLGRVVDPLGRPIDGGSVPPRLERWPAERAAPGIADRQPITEPLLTGITVIDAMFPIGKGQRQLILGDRGTGKSTIAIDTVIHQKSQGVRCVYVSIGQTTSSVVTLLDTLRRHDVMDNTTVVVARSDDPPGVRFLAPYAGCTMAEYFRDRGEDALVVFDDLSAHAVAYRELSLLLRRAPGREAYPGDIFFVHSRLLERATRLEQQLGGGSLTALPLVETQAGRISDFIPTNIISITDGQLYLDPQLFDRGFKPAVEVGISVSRVGGKTQRPSMKAVAGRLRLDLARFQELEVFTRFGARVEEETRRLLVRGERARELLKQGPSQRIPMGEQVALLLALEDGHFDSIDLRLVTARAEALSKELRHSHPDLLRSLDLGSPPNAADRELIEQVMTRLGAP